MLHPDEDYFPAQMFPDLDPLTVPLDESMFLMLGNTCETCYKVGKGLS